MVEANRQHIQRGAVIDGLLVGLVIFAAYMTLQQVSSEPSLPGIDLTAYLAAAERMTRTGIPYAPELLQGPIEHAMKNVSIGYLYPPLLAQIFIPLLHVPKPVLALVWGGAQAVLLLALLPIVFRARGGGSGRGVTGRLLLVGVAFWPLHWAALVGNVSGWVAVGVAVALLGPHAARSLAAAVLTVAKVTPGALLAGALIAPSTRRASVLMTLALLSTSMLIAPDAWRSFVTVLPSLSAMPAAAGPFNVAPLAGLDIGVAQSVGRLTVAAALLSLTAWGAWNGRTLVWVSGAVGVYLSATPTTWYHYLVVLLPLGVAAWPTASPTLRVLMASIFIAYGPLWRVASDVRLQLVATSLWVIAIGLLAWRESHPSIQVTRESPNPGVKGIA